MRAELPLGTEAGIGLAVVEEAPDPVPAVLEDGGDGEDEHPEGGATNGMAFRAVTNPANCRRVCRRRTGI